MALVYLKITLNRLILMGHAKVSSAGGKCFPVALGLPLFLASDIVLQGLLPSIQQYQWSPNPSSLWGWQDGVLASTGAVTAQAAACSPFQQPCGMLYSWPWGRCGSWRKRHDCWDLSLLSCWPCQAGSCRTSFFTAFYGQALSLPFWPTSLESFRQKKVEQSPKRFPCYNPCSADVQFSGLLMSKFLLRRRGAGLGQGALPLAVNEYFQNRALTFLKESVLAVLLQAHLSWASLRPWDSHILTFISILKMAPEMSAYCTTFLWHGVLFAYISGV